MKTKKPESFIQQAFLIYIEEPEDILLRVEAVVFFRQQGNPLLYCQDSRYNFIRTVLNRFQVEDLQKGIVFREHHIELRPIPSHIEIDLPFDVSQIPSILTSIHMINPKMFWFLRKVSD